MRLLEPLAMQSRISKVIFGSGYTHDGRYFLNPLAWRSAQIVVIHRNFPSAETMPLIKQIARSGVRLIYETDDAFQLLPDDHPKSFHKVSAPYINECADTVDVVVVATPALATLFRWRAPTIVLPNMLSPRIWTTQPEAPDPADVAPKVLRAALVGGTNHLGDFMMLQEAIREISSSCMVEWVCYGDGAIRALDAIGVRAAQSIKSNFHYPSHPARIHGLRANIGICPLVDTAFNHCVSDLKFLEFGYFGVPIIGSALSGYSSTIENRINGYLCGNDASWISCVTSAAIKQNELIACGRNAKDQVIRTRTLMRDDPAYAVFCDLSDDWQAKVYVA